MKGIMPCGHQQCVCWLCYFFCWLPGYQCLLGSIRGLLQYCCLGSYRSVGVNCTCTHFLVMWMQLQFPYICDQRCVSFLQLLWEKRMRVPEMFQLKARVRFDPSSLPHSPSRATSLTPSPSLSLSLTLPSSPSLTHSHSLDPSHSLSILIPQFSNPPSF